MGIIYLSTNRTNLKKYIGQTIAPLQQRKSEHLYIASRPGDTRNTPFTSAIRKHGPDNFSWEILLSCNEEHLNHYESKAIEMNYSLCSQHGYNVKDSAGTGCRSCVAHKRKYLKDCDLPAGVTATPTGFGVRLRSGQQKYFTAQWLTMEEKLQQAVDWLQIARRNPDKAPGRKMKRFVDEDDDLPAGVYRAKNGYYVSVGVHKKSFKKMQLYTLSELKVQAIQYATKIKESDSVDFHQLVVSYVDSDCEKNSKYLVKCTSVIEDFNSKSELAMSSVKFRKYCQALGFYVREINRKGIRRGYYFMGIRLKVVS